MKIKILILALLLFLILFVSFVLIRYRANRQVPNNISGEEVAEVTIRKPYATPKEDITQPPLPTKEKKNLPFYSIHKTEINKFEPYKVDLGNIPDYFSRVREVDMQREYVEYVFGGNSTSLISRVDFKSEVPFFRKEYIRVSEENDITLNIFEFIDGAPSLPMKGYQIIKNNEIVRIFSDVLPAWDSKVISDNYRYMFVPSLVNTSKDNTLVAKYQIYDFQNNSTVDLPADRDSQLCEIDIYNKENLDFLYKFSLTNNSEMEAPFSCQYSYKVQTVIDILDKIQKGSTDITLPVYKIGIGSEKV